MVDRLKRLASRSGMAIAATAMFGALPAAAETLPDPTRPPPGFADDAVVAGAAAATATTAAGGPVLQTVVLPKKGRPKAVISGEMVLLGGKYGDQTLVRISEREVVLDGPRGKEVLTLTPGIEKKMRKQSSKPVVGANSQ